MILILLYLFFSVKFLNLKIYYLIKNCVRINQKSIIDEKSLEMREV